MWVFSFFLFHLLMQNILLFTMSHEFLIIQEDLLLHFAHISPITICKTNYITTSKQRTKLHLVSHKDSTYILIWIYKQNNERGWKMIKLDKNSFYLIKLKIFDFIKKKLGKYWKVRWCIKKIICHLREKYCKKPLSFLFDYHTWTLYSSAHIWLHYTLSLWQSQHNF